MSEQQRIISVDYHQLKGLKDVKISFEPNQVTGIFGTNGCGKSTILHSLLCFYKPKDNSAKDYKFSNFFKPSAKTPWTGSSMDVEIRYRERGNMISYFKNYHKTTDRWVPKYSRRPDRHVFFLGINSCVPDIEEFSKTAAPVELGNPENIDRYEEILQAASNIMNFHYTELKSQPLKSYKKKCRLVNKQRTGGDLSYTSLNMGAGEQRVFRIVEILVNAPKYSLIIIDEIDLTLHTAALNRLMDYIVDMAKRNSLQVVFTSHREELVRRKDINVRHLLQTGDETFCLEDTTPECIDRMTGATERVLDVFVEDDLAESIVAKLCSDLKIRKRVSIHCYGSIENAFVACIGMDILGQDTSKMLFVLDGDRYRTEEDKIRQLNNKYSGNEPDKEERRKKALSLITQFELQEGRSPEEHIQNVLINSSNDNEVVSCAKDIYAVTDKHDYIDRIVDNIGEDRKICLSKIIDEFSKNEQEWIAMTHNVSEWLDRKKKECNL